MSVNSYQLKMILFCELHLTKLLTKQKKLQMKSLAHPRVIERGILTSAYKQEIRQSIRDMKKDSVSQIKNSFLSQHDKLRSQTAAIVRVSLFTLALVFILL